MIVLGIDGLDYHLVRDLIGQGRLPNLARLGEGGRFTPLATSTPPQSPVAWSTFITGLDPGEHGIFDFIHRHPDTLESFLSTSRTVPPGRMLTLGRWQFPLQAGRVELLRQGTPFWEVLEARGIETTIVRMPANFPPSGTATRELSGMGTPDMLGTYGIFTLFTSRPEVFERQDVSGGMILPIDVIDGVARGVDRRAAESVSGDAGADHGGVRGPRRSRRESSVKIVRRRPVAGAARRRVGRLAAGGAAAGAADRRSPARCGSCSSS